MKLPAEDESDPPQPATRPVRHARRQRLGTAATSAPTPPARTSSVLDPAPLTGQIGTGRPSFGTGTTPVPVGHLQLESGYQYAEDGDSKTHTFPQLLLRYGVYDGVELRAGWTGVVIPEGGDSGDERPAVRRQARRP